MERLGEKGDSGLRKTVSGCLTRVVRGTCWGFMLIIYVNSIALIWLILEMYYFRRNRWNDWTSVNGNMFEFFESNLLILLFLYDLTIFFNNPIAASKCLTTFSYNNCMRASSLTVNNIFIFNITFSSNLHWLIRFFYI